MSRLHGLLLRQITISEINIDFILRYINLAADMFFNSRRFKKYSNHAFSLIETVSAITILVLIIAISFQFISSTQNIMQISENSRGPAEDARIALDLIARDLQAAYYGGNSTDGYAIFWHKGVTSGWGDYDNELIAFVSSVQIGSETDNASPYYEIKYQLSSSAQADSEGWIMRSVTGKSLNDTNYKWNWKDNPTFGQSCSVTPLTSSNRYAQNAFTANDDSSDIYQKMIPYVTDLSFVCYNNPGTEIDADTDNLAVRSDFPYSVDISLTLMNDKAWTKWIELGRDSTFKQNNQKTFTRSVYIGERGQGN
jgi:type II secretory pathway component PulJ